MKYCLEKYFNSLGVKKPNRKSAFLILNEFNRVDSPIYKEMRIPGLTLEKRKRIGTRQKYNDYLKSSKWKAFRDKIIFERGQRCELCKAYTKPLHLHHKTYERLFNELPQDVSLLCLPCHKKSHDKKAAL